MLELAEDLDLIYEEYTRRGWTDGLPIVPPTEPRVDAMLRAIGMAPDHVLCQLAPQYAQATAHLVAVNAVMAGCRPEYGPIVVAAVRACAYPEFNLYTIQTTTNAVTPLVLVSGPISAACQINGGVNALGQGWRANATIGRALRLVLVNVGGAVPGAVDKATIGHPGKYTFCCAEREDANPWGSYAVSEAGFRPEESAVTVFGVTGITNVVDWSESAEELAGTLRDSIRQTGSNDYLSGGEPLLLLCPEHAAIFARDGWSRHDLQYTIWDTTRIPLDAFPRKTRDMIRLRRGEEPSIRDQSLVPLAVKPDGIHIAVVGGESIHSALLSTVGVTRPSSVKIEGT